MTETNERKIINLAGAFVFEYLNIKKSQESDDIADELRNFFAIRSGIQSELDRMAREVACLVPLPEKIDVYNVTLELLISLAAKKGVTVLIHNGVLTFTDKFFTNCDVRQFTDSPPEQLLEAADWLNTLESVKS